MQLLCNMVVSDVCGDWLSHSVTCQHVDTAHSRSHAPSVIYLLHIASFTGLCAIECGVGELKATDKVTQTHMHMHMDLCTRTHASAHKRVGRRTCDGLQNHHDAFSA